MLDNLEQVVAAAPELARLQSRCPNLSVLATSREPLRIAGEREFPLAPLAEAPAVELFRQRAQAVLPGFSCELRHGSPRSAVASTACRWRSSWRPPA